MQRRQIIGNLNLINSEQIDFELDKDKNLSVLFKLTNDTTLKIIFKEVIRFFFKTDGLVKELYEVLDIENLNKELSLVYHSVPSNHFYRLFEIENINNKCFFKIIAKEINIFDE